MRAFLGVLMIMAGIFLGLYVGVWLCVVGGIVDIVNNFNHGTVGGVLWGLVKFVLAGPFGWVSACILLLPGAALCNE